MEAAAGEKWRGSRMTVRPPSDYVLRRDVCSYGYFLLAPNRWDVERQAFSTALDLDPNGAPVGLVVTQPRARPGEPLTIRCDRSLSRAEQTGVKRRLARMLRLDEDEAHVRDFHRVDPRWRLSGRGRLFRSSTLFEDVIKTVTSCNVTWPSTTRMNVRLCDVVGRRTASGARAFPTARKLARTRVQTLRSRCSVGYRDRRIVDLARIFSRGEVDEAWLAAPGTRDEDVFRFLKGLPGIGPYAAANIMMLLGRYSRLALDTESVRHGRTVLGYQGDERLVMKRLAAHYDAFGEHRFRSYWFELWDDYEGRHGPAHTWVRETTGQQFTASRLG